MLFVVLCPGTPEGSTGSGSGFKASQRTGQPKYFVGLLLLQFIRIFLKLFRCYFFRGMRSNHTLVLGYCQTIYKCTC